MQFSSRCGHSNPECAASTRMVRVLVPGSSPSVFRQDLEHVLQDATAQSTGQSLIFQRKEIKQKEKREKRKEKRDWKELVSPLL